MFKHKHSKKSKLFRKYFISYLAVMLLCLLIVVIAYNMSVKIIEVEITNAHYKSLIQIKNISESILKELEMLYIQIGFDDKIQMLMSLQPEMTPVQLLEMATLEKELKTYCLSYPAIKDIYLYFERSDTVLSNYGRHRLDIFTESVFKYDSDIFTEWINGEDVGMDVFLGADDMGNEKNMMAYIRTLPIGRRGNSLGKLIVVVDDEVINEEMDKFEWIEQGLRFVINQDNEVFLTGNTVDPDFGVTYESLDGDEAVNSQGEMVLSFIPSDNYDWKYVYIIPKNIFFEKAKKVRIAIEISFLIVLVMGFFLSYFFAKKYYGPIDNLIMFIQNNLKELKKQDEDEYNFIKNIISNTLSEKEAYQENIKKFSERLRNEFLMRLFRGRMNNNAIEHMKRIHNVDIDDNANYLMIMAYLDDISLMNYENYPEEEIEENLDIARLILINTLDELLQWKFKRLYVKEGDLICYLIDTGGKAPDGAFAEVRIIKDKLLDISRNKFRIGIFVALSNVYKGYEGIKKAFRQADKDVEYYLLTGKEQESFAGPEKPEKPTMISFDFRKDIEQFAQSIMAKDLIHSKELLNAIFKKWFIEGRPPANIIKYRMSETINACINSIENLKISYDRNFMDCMQIMNILFNCKNIEELQSETNKLLDSLNEYIAEMDSSEQGLIQKSVKYIDDNYQNSDLNISSIAAHFDINAPYLSRQFKKNTGMGPLEYLQLKRIEESKKLLRESNDSIKRISQKVGFTYEVSFIRVFKKFEGVTPGIFRG